jgi:hypothetical protein
MKKSDPEADNKGLAEYYAAAPDEELRQLADDAGSLTVAAREVLRAELSLRGKAVELRDSPVPDERHPRLVTIRRFRDVPNALLAKSVLDSAQIQCFLSDENAIRLDWLWSNALGGIKLLVTELHFPCVHVSGSESVLTRLARMLPSECFSLGRTDGDFEPFGSIRMQ